MNSQRCSKQDRKSRHLSASGQSVVELAVVAPLLALMLVVVADFGRLFYMSIGLNNAARAGAQYGSQSVFTAADSAGMTAAAAQDGSNVPGMTTTPSQCTCGTPSANVLACPSSYCTHDPKGNYTEVDTQATFHTTIAFPGVPASTTLQGKAIMQVQQQ